MAEGLVNESIKERFGCMDPSATNYDPLATSPCAGCCTYQQSVVGCMDPIATNYNPSATVACDGCCDYGEPLAPSTLEPETTFNPGGFTPDSGTNEGLTPDDGPEEPIDPCQGLVLQITIDGIVQDGNGNPIPESCCTSKVVGGTVYWDNATSKTGVCRAFRPVEEDAPPQGLCEAAEAGQILDITNRVTCVDCDNFTWWNNLYISTHGSSLQETNQPLWDYLVEVLNSNEPAGSPGGSFYVDNLTGDIVSSQGCCDLLAPESTFINTTDENNNQIEVCLCELIPQEIPLSCKCITTVEEFVQIASTKAGEIAILNTDTLVGIGLSLDDANYIITNLYSNDFDEVEARTLLSNALYVSGGFYLCFETDLIQQITLINKPVAVDETKCSEFKGSHWTGSVCLCNHVPDCELTITDVKVSLEQDGLGNSIEVVTFNGVSIDEDCCNAISNDNGFGWVYELGVDGVSRCYHKPPAECNPIQFQLNETPIEAECPTPIEITAWLNFGRPEDPCQPYPPEDDDVIVIPGDDDPCILEFDENNNIVEATDVHVKRTQAPLMESLPGFDESQTGETPPNGEIPEQTTTPANPTEPCCYNQNIPIRARLIVVTETEEIQTPIVEYNSGIDGFDTWVQLSTELIPSDTLGTFDVKLEFYQGLNCCCTYDIYLDGLKVSCREEVVIEETLVDDCPGFDIQHVIDNKKSWVYNPGKPGYSDIPEDSIVVDNGDIGLIQGHGTINRTFAPSEDAELPWRYTDYFNQSSVLERHSNLVINSKELFLTFDMCGVGKACPDGYSISGNTELCCKESPYDTIEYTILATCKECGECTLDVTYTDTWGEEIVITVNKDESVTVCAVAESVVPEKPGDGICDDITIKKGDDCEKEIICTEPLNDCKKNLSLLHLESYKKVFQSFWVQFVEQFVPATTIFVSGEKWCNRPEDICTIYEECDFDFEFVEGEVTSTPNEGGFDFLPTPDPDGSKSFDPETNDPTEGQPVEPGPLQTTEGGEPIDTPNLKIRPLDGDLGLNSEEPVSIPNEEEQQQNATEYYDNLNSQPTETIIE